MTAKLARFIWDSRHRETRFKNSFEGNLVLDITAWCGQCPNEYLDAFLYYLKDREDKIHCVMICESDIEPQILSAVERLWTVDVIDLSADPDVGAGRKKRSIGFSMDADCGDMEENSNV